RDLEARTRARNRVGRGHRLDHPRRLETARHALLHQREAVMNQPASEQDTNDSEPIDTELLARLEAAVSTLPRFARDVFLANRIDDLSYAEIGRITRTSEARVRREMARAIYGIARAM